MATSKPKLSNKKSEKSDLMIFEYPLQENIRSFLRLESLFNLVQRNIRSNDKDNHLHALKLLFEILEILERGDTRSELIKELSRLLEYYQILKENPEVDSSKLTQFLKQIRVLHEWVHAYQGKFGESVRRDPFIENVKFRSAIPGGSCQFDSPDLCLFMNKNADDRRTKFGYWLNEIKGVETSVEVILRLIRDQAEWTQESAPLGSFMIDTTGASYKLLRIKGIVKEDIFPELSSGKHRSSIHFMRFSDEHKKMPANIEIMFELACCC